MSKLLFMAEGVGGIFEKMLDINKAVLECSINEPLNVMGCLHEKTMALSPTYAAMREVGVGEFDITPEDILIDGIVIDEERAKTTPCKCINYNGKELCWSPGVIGMLRQDQVREYCPTKNFEEKPNLVKHLNEFKKIAEETKGMPLPEKIAFMRNSLKEEGHPNYEAPYIAEYDDFDDEDEPEDDEEYARVIKTKSGYTIFDPILHQSKIEPWPTDLDTTVDCSNVKGPCSAEKKAKEL